MNGNDNFLLDTNIVLGFLNGNILIKNIFDKTLRHANLSVSQITRMELLAYPEISSNEEDKIKQFLSYLAIIPVSDPICDRAIHIRRETKLKLPDALIAATAAVSNLTLLTCDSDLLNKKSYFKSLNPIAA